MSHSHKGNTLTALLTMLPIWAIAIVMSLSLSECSETTDNSNPIPRPTAYPRINLCDSTYSSIAHLPINIEANSQTSVTIKGRPAIDPHTSWIDIYYPAYNGTIHCTLSLAGKTPIADVINNRMERFALEASMGPVETINIESDTLWGQITTCRQNLVAPITFIATDNHRWAISGTFNFNTRQALNYDSIAPAIIAVKNDINHLINAITISRR